MATGIHWEWRGFGELAGTAREKIAALPTLFPAPMEFRDRYLWIPGCAINIKLRSGGESGLKFKRLLDSRGQLELWEERIDELYPFPLEPDTFRRLTRELGTRPPGLPGRPIADEKELLRRLDGSQPGVHVIEVHKRRMAHWLEVPMPGRSCTVIVEIAEISAPQRTWSVALEEASGLDSSSSPERLDLARQSVAAALANLGLPGGLRAMNYLAALELWSRGDPI